MESFQLKNHIYPKISFSEPELTFGQKNITMVNEHSYRDDYMITKSLWYNNPFSSSIAAPEAELTNKKESYSVQQYTAEFTLSRDCQNCVLILKNTFHPNWHVKINGKKTEAFPVFPFYIGIPIEKAGNYNIIAIYKPGWLKVVLIWAGFFSVIGFLFSVFRYKLFRFR